MPFNNQVNVVKKSHLMELFLSLIFKGNGRGKGCISKISDISKHEYFILDNTKRFWEKFLFDSHISTKNSVFA